jgi:hypothetical protein
MENVDSWIFQWDKELRQEAKKGRPRQILLLLDNFSGHTVDVEDLEHIRVEFFAPNMTSKVQPLDQGIIRAFKAHYRRE